MASPSQPRADAPPAVKKRIQTPEQQFRSRLRKAWARLATDQGRLLAAYQRSFGAKKTGPDLLQSLVEAARAPGARALPTTVPQVSRHVIKLGDDMPAAQLVCWTDEGGAIADVRLARSDRPEHVDLAARDLLAGARNRHNVTTATEESSATRTQLRQLWQRRSGKELDPITEAWHRLPGNALAADFHVLEYLQGLTKQPGVRALPTDGAGIQRFILDVPGIDTPVDILLRELPDGTLGDLRFAPQKKDALPWLVRLMEKGEANSIQRKTAAPKQGPRNANSLWAPLKTRLADEFEACREARRQRSERVPAAGAFVRHLDALCLAAGEGEVVDADLDVRRFVITPEGSTRAITLLRRADERGLAALRLVEPDLSDQEAMLKDIRHYARTAPAGAAPATPASPAPVKSAEAAGPSTTTAPGSGRAMRDAWQLKQALEIAVANKGRGGDLLAGADKASGVPDKELRRWLGPDGALLLTPGALLKLKGYYDLRDDFETLFAELGQPESVAKLPGELTAEMTLRMVQARRAQPDAPTAKLARMSGVHPEVAKRYFDVSHETFLKASNERLRRMPDYAENRAAIQAALVAIGQTDRAGRLPVPETAAETFLRELEERLYQVRMAVTQMRRDPALSAGQAVRLVNAWPEMPALLERLVQPGGQLRAADEIARGLPGFEAGLLPLLQRLLGRLAPGTGGGEMTEELMPAKGLAPGKVFIVRDPSGAHDGRAGAREGKATRTRRLEQIYANSKDLEVPPRSYRQERQKQGLRWLSTFLKSRFDKATEVQAYWDAPRGELWVSSNNTGANADIETFLKNGGLARALEELQEDTHASREVRHASRLRQMMKDESARPPQARELMAALFAGKVRVPTEAIFSSGSGHRIELHAERRIKLAFEKQHGDGSLDRRLIAGTMRPCGICAKDLGLPASARRGPFWMSRAAMEGHDLVAHAEHDRDAGIGTYITRTRQGALTVAYNTDSDDGAQLDDRDNALGKRGAQDRPSDARQARPVKRR